MTPVPSRTGKTPVWIPTEAVHYLTHTELGCSMRAIARRAGCHASTISRQIRRFENRRDDPLVDAALDRIGSERFFKKKIRLQNGDDADMTATKNSEFRQGNDGDITRNTLRILRRLAENGAVLAVAAEMPNAVVVRDLPGGKTARTAVVARHVAEVMALNEWIACAQPSRIMRYKITPTGRAALKRMIAESEAGGMAEAAQPFADQHRIWGERETFDEVQGRSQKVKYNMAESPLTALARRRDKGGNPFLSDDLVAAGERLREDFELAQMGPRVTQNWDRFLNGGSAPMRPDSGIAEGPREARERVGAALRALGPGLGDVVLRCCCYLEGIETTERKMGWSARSGKIVLKIALQRLQGHYELTGGKYAPLIG
ncbi:MAG: DUF6456 domain-containing protein [Qingshengfaniella sp.]